MNVGDKVWTAPTCLEPTQQVTIVYMGRGKVVVEYKGSNMAGDSLEVFHPGDLFDEKPLLEEVRVIKSVIQNVSEAVNGEYQDDYFCTKLAEQLYYEGWRK